MAFMNWLPDYQFGIPLMDDQHRHWLELLNEFYYCLESGNRKNRQLSLLDEAINYTHFHFQEEEHLMSDIGYMALTEQVMMHKAIGQKLEAFWQDIAYDKPLTISEITGECRDWFKRHILVEDRKYMQAYLLAKNEIIMY
jgi:hemerythrin